MRSALHATGAAQKVLALPALIGLPARDDLPTAVHPNVPLRVRVPAGVPDRLVPAPAQRGRGLLPRVSGAAREHLVDRRLLRGYSAESPLFSVEKTIVTKPANQSSKSPSRKDLVGAPKHHAGRWVDPRQILTNVLPKS